MKGKNNVTLLGACKLLNRSKKTISRYIKKGWLNPERIESKRGSLEYRFNQVDLLKFKKPGRTERTEQTRPDTDIITFLKAEIKEKNEQIKNKDEQINQLIERSRETNILLKGLQNQLLLTEGKKEVREDRPGRPDKTGQGLNGFFRRLFKGDICKKRI